ncbi:MAG TPA: acetate/propionate family kinase [Woeseiaceae bacterium]|nr:acetate/propionate family kinase [Woeseiaceae bacterium]
MGEASWLLTFNAGSSSLKVGVFEYRDGVRSRLRFAVRDIGRESSTLSTGTAAEDLGHIDNVEAAATLVLDRLENGIGGTTVDRRSVAATGHRIVHGGEHYASAVRVNRDVFETLDSLNHLAPLHNPPALAIMKIVRERFPGVALVADFDTAFFHDLPEAARVYAVPSGLAERHAIRRYGFHGLAHQFMSRQLELLSPDGKHPDRMVTLQLGQGCSAAALRDGRPVETSMGFTPMEGLVMGTRSGDVDAGVLLYLAQQGYPWDELEDVLNRKSGLLGLSGESDDTRALLELEARQHPGARLALQVFCHRILKYLGAYAAVLGGIDAIAFGGGIGENAPVIRSRVCSGLGWLGVQLDEDANAGCTGKGGRISTDESSIDVHVVPVDEEAIIAAATWHILRGADDRAS